MKYKYGDFTLYMYPIRKVIMYNSHLDTQPGDLGPFKGCYSVTSTERSFSPRSKKRLETSKHPLNGGSGIFLFELIGINRGMIEKVGQNLSPKVKQVGYRRSNCRWIHILNFEAWRHTCFHTYPNGSCRSSYKLDSDWSMGKWLNFNVITLFLFSI